MNAYEFVNISITKTLSSVLFPSLIEEGSVILVASSSNKLYFSLLKSKIANGTDELPVVGQYNDL